MEVCTLWQALDNIYKAGVPREVYILFREIVYQLTAKQIEDATNKAATLLSKEVG